MNREEELRKVKEAVINCDKCPLSKYRKENNYYPVIGEGNHKAKIVLIGEAPGLEEAKQGRPFCGRAGKILDKLLEGVGIKRKEVYITNLLKDKPPSNRDPKKEEIEACAPYLEKQLSLIKPKVIGCLGNFSTSFILKKYGLESKIEGISKIHGKVFSSETDAIKIIPFYHPAVATYNPKMINTLKKDFFVLKDF